MPIFFQCEKIKKYCFHFAGSFVDLLGIISAPDRQFSLKSLVTFVIRCVFVSVFNLFFFYENFNMCCWYNAIHDNTNQPVHIIRNDSLKFLSNRFFPLSSRCMLTLKFFLAKLTESRCSFETNEMLSK